MSKKPNRRVVACVLSLAIASALLPLTPAWSQVTLVFSKPDTLRDQKTELAMKIRQPFNVVTVGDMIQMVPFSNNTDPSIQSLMTLMRKADVTMANNENTVVDHDTFRGVVSHMEAPRTVADDWANMGIKMMTKANNHTFDNSDDGITQDFQQLDRVGITHVGVDYNVQEARMARFLATPKGTVALFGAYVNDVPGAAFGLPVKDPVYVTAEQLRQLRAMRDEILARRREVPHPIALPEKDPEGEVLVFGTQFKVGKPGDKIVGDPTADHLLGEMHKSFGRHKEVLWKRNDLHVAPAFSVTVTQLAQLRAIAGSAGQQQGDTLQAFGTSFVARSKPGELIYTIDPQDLRNDLREIRTAKQFSDFEAATVHWHQNRYVFQRYSFDHYPPQFEIDFAHAAIDQGADLFFAHGVHTLKGVEIYKGKPIFYGIGNFVFQEQIFRSWRDFSTAPTDAPLDGPIKGESQENEKSWNWLEDRANREALLTSSTYDNGRLKEVRLYPVELGIPDRPSSQFGIPKTPQPDVAQKMLEEVVEYSKPFGTKISIENGVGVIRVSQ